MTLSPLSKLELFCDGNFNERVFRFLKEDPNIDIWDRGVWMFWYPIRNNNPEILKALLEYYENGLQLEYDSPEYRVVRFKLQEKLQEYIYNSQPSKEILEALENYLPPDYSSTNMSISEFEDSFDSDSEESRKQIGKIQIENEILSIELLKDSISPI